MYDSKHSASSHEPKNGILSIHFHESIDSDDILKRELVHLAAAAKQKGVKKILIHNGDLSHPINGELQRWAEVSIELPLLRHGVDKIAIVRPSKGHVFALTNHTDTPRKKYFRTDKAAMKWLNE
jgi:hypothetical protein